MIEDDYVSLSGCKNQCLAEMCFTHRQDYDIDLRNIWDFQETHCGFIVPGVCVWSMFSFPILQQSTSVCSSVWLLLEQTWLCELEQTDLSPAQSWMYCLYNSEGIDEGRAAEAAHSRGGGEGGGSLGVDDMTLGFGSFADILPWAPPLISLCASQRLCSLAALWSDNLVQPPSGEMSHQLGRAWHNVKCSFEAVKARQISFCLF